jgi:nitrite reductase/ring-hydroxylating ferredoxin subunit
MSTIAAFASGCSSSRGGKIFGRDVTAGTLEHVRRGIADGGGAFYVAAARSFLVEPSKAQHEDARDLYPKRIVAGLDATGLLAIYQRCTHQGCRTPLCKTSGWFECPCHFARFDGAGDMRDGQAKRGLDRFPLSLVGDRVVIHTGDRIEGNAPGVHIGADAIGPHCISAAGDP